MTLEGWEDLNDEKISSVNSRSGGDPQGHNPHIPPPPPQYAPSTTNSLIFGTTEPPTSTPRLHILGATWGGIVVTPDIQTTINITETTSIDMGFLHRILVPDPLPNTVKTLSVLYEYEGSSEGPCLLNASETSPTWRDIVISPEAHQAPKTAPSGKLGVTWRYGSVEILAVMYAMRRIEQPAILNELGKFFEGQRGQLRMTNSFFQCDPWPNHKKTWTVYFRFVGSKKVQVVTGVEDGALEVPWSRD
jgi:hypothetical protein